MVELGTRWTFKPGDRLSIMDSVSEHLPVSITSHAMGIIEPGRVLQTHLGHGSGVGDPQGHARVRTSMGGDVLHRRNAGYQVPSASHIDVKLCWRYE